MQSTGELEGIINELGRERERERERERDGGESTEITVCYVDTDEGQIHYSSNGLRR